MKNSFFKVTAFTLAVVLFSPFYMNAQSQGTERQVFKEMKSATRFMVEAASNNGGFVWNYLPDLYRTRGELEVKRTMMWIQLRNYTKKQ